MKMKFAYIGIVALLFVSCKKSGMVPPAANKDYAVVTVENNTAELNVAYPAMIKGMQDTEIRPKISGFITKVAVKEGDVVKAGQVLFTIDNEQYKAMVLQAKAQIAQIRSSIATQELNVKNRQMLNERGVTSAFDLQTAQNTLLGLRAQLAQAKAALISAQDNLKFCTITSPSNGVVGEIPYRVGSLVSASLQVPLTTISNTTAIYVYFSITEKEALLLSRNSGSLNEAIQRMPPVALQLADGSMYEEKGKVTALSGVIDGRTGALTMRADFPNPKGLLRSGGTGNVLMPSVNAAALSIPQVATYEIQDKKFVYVVEADSAVASREITVLSQNDGTNYIVTHGLKAGERIVIEGVATLKTGDKIRPITPTQAAKNREQAAKDLKEGKM